jgi:hypothetical protein
MKAFRDEMKAALFEEVLTISLKAVRVSGEFPSSYLGEYHINIGDRFGVHTLKDHPPTEM